LHIPCFIFTAHKGRHLDTVATEGVQINDKNTIAKNKTFDAILQRDSQ
jgi:hypothetical protein